MAKAHLAPLHTLPQERVPAPASMTPSTCTPSSQAKRAALRRAPALSQARSQLSLNLLVRRCQGVGDGGPSKHGLLHLGGYDVAELRVVADIVAHHARERDGVDIQVALGPELAVHVALEARHLPHLWIWWNDVQAEFHQLGHVLRRGHGLHKRLGSVHLRG